MNVALLTTSPAAIARAAALFGAPMTVAARDRLSDSQIEALTDAADKAAHAEAVSKMRDTLHRLFLTGMQRASTAPSTPRVPKAIRFNVAGQDERDRWAYRVFLEPVTVVAYDLLETKGGADDHLHLLLVDSEKLAEMRATQLRALAAEYAEAQAEALVAAGWQE